MRLRQPRLLYRGCMKLRLKPVRDQVMVITGATSGIGLATARLAHRRGARLVLAARSERALTQLAAELGSPTGRAIAVRADVSLERHVERLAAAACDSFGGFDTWINNAAVSAYGKCLEVTLEDMRRIMDTNFWGVVYGSRAACAPRPWCSRRPVRWPRSAAWCPCPGGP